MTYAWPCMWNSGTLKSYTIRETHQHTPQESRTQPEITSSDDEPVYELPPQVYKHYSKSHTLQLMISNIFNPLIILHQLLIILKHFLIFTGFLLIIVWQSIFITIS
jgi:hypothetical protein